MKTKTKEKAADQTVTLPTHEDAHAVAAELVESPELEFQRLQESRNMLIAALDWCGENQALVFWGESGSGRPQLRVRAEDLQVECGFADPIEGFLEGVNLMQARLARKKVNVGL